MMLPRSPQKSWYMRASWISDAARHGLIALLVLDQGGQDMPHVVQPLDVHLCCLAGEGHPSEDPCAVVDGHRLERNVRGHSQRGPPALGARFVEFAVGLAPRVGHVPVADLRPAGDVADRAAGELLLRECLFQLRGGPSRDVSIFLHLRQLRGTAEQVQHDDPAAVALLLVLQEAVDRLVHQLPVLVGPDREGVITTVQPGRILALRKETNHAAGEVAVRHPIANMVLHALGALLRQSAGLRP